MYFLLVSEVPSRLTRCVHPSTHSRPSTCNHLVDLQLTCNQGKSATCNPISEPDLAAALIDTISDKSKENALWNLGGPDEGLSMRQQGEMLADVLDKEEAKLLGVS